MSAPPRENTCSRLSCCLVVCVWVGGGVCGCVWGVGVCVWGVCGCGMCGGVYVCVCVGLTFSL